MNKLFLSISKSPFTIITAMVILKETEENHIKLMYMFTRVHTHTHTYKIKCQAAICLTRFSFQSHVKRPWQIQTTARTNLS